MFRCMLEAGIAQSTPRSPWWEFRNGPVKGMEQSMSDLLLPKGQLLGTCTMSVCYFLVSVKDNHCSGF